jgi:hypothetical protein
MEAGDAAGTCRKRQQFSAEPDFGETQRATSAEPLPVQLIAVDDIDPSPLNRGSRDIDELAVSVREHGVQQPIKVRPQGARFEIVYGERRFRAAKKVGLKEVPATVEYLTEEEAHTLRVLENACRTVMWTSPLCCVVAGLAWRSASRVPGCCA